MAEATTRRVGVFAVFIRTAEADDGVYERSNCTDGEQEKPSCKIDPDRVPRGSVKVKREPWHDERQKNQPKGDALLWPRYVNRILR